MLPAVVCPTLLVHHTDTVEDLLVTLIPRAQVWVWLRYALSTLCSRHSQIYFFEVDKQRCPDMSNKMGCCTRPTLKTSPLSAHSLRPNSPSWGRMKTEWPSLRFTSVYSAEAMVASGVLPWHLIRPLCRATLAMSPVAISRFSRRRTCTAAFLKMPPPPLPAVCRCSRSAAVLGRTPMKRPVSSLMGTLPRLARLLA